MAHYLQFDGVNDVVNLASVVTPSGTTLESSFYIEFEIAFRNTSSFAANSIFGPDRSLFRRSDGLLLTQGAGGSGEIRVNYPGVLVDEFHVFKIEKTGGNNTYSVSMDGGALTTKLMANKLRLGKIGHSSDGYSKIYLKRMTLIDHLDSTNSVNLDPNASDTSNTGLQPVLVDTLNGNNATGTGFPTDGSAWVYYDDGGAATQNVDMNLASATPVVYSPEIVASQEIDMTVVSGAASVYDFDVLSEQFVDFEIASGTTTVYLMEVLSGVTEIEMELTYATPSVLSPEVLAGVVEVFPTLIPSVANVYMLRLEYLQYIDAITIEAETEVFLPGQEPVSPGRTPVVVIEGQRAATSGGTVSLVAYVLNSLSTANYTFVWSVESGEGLLTKLVGQHTSVILPLMNTANNVTIRCIATLDALELTTVHLITTASGDTTMATKPNLRLLQSTSWISLNTATSIAVGTAFTVRNNGQVPLKYFEGVAAPTDISSYEVLYPPYFGVLSILQVSAGADEIFVLNDSSVEVNLSINS